MRLKLKELLLKMLMRSIATYSNSVLTFGNLKIFFGQATVPSANSVSINIPSGTFSQVVWAIPSCGQARFGAYDTVSVVTLTTSVVEVYQFNVANVNMVVNVAVIGLA